MSLSIVAMVVHNGLPKLASQLSKEAERAVAATLKAGQDDVTRGMHASSSPSAPGAYPGIDSGRLVGSIQTQQQGAEGMLYTETYYSVYLEYGTSKMLPRPFFTPAARVMQDTLNREMNEAIKRLGG